MCMYMYVHTCIYMYLRTCTCTHELFKGIWTYIHIHVYVYNIYMYMYLQYLYMYICSAHSRNLRILQNTLRNLGIPRMRAILQNGAQSRNLSPFTLRAINYVHNMLRSICMCIASLRAIFAVPYCYVYHNTKWY